MFCVLIEPASIACFSPWLSSVKMSITKQYVDISQLKDYAKHNQRILIGRLSELHLRRYRPDFPSFFQTWLLGNTRYYNLD